MLDVTMPAVERRTGLDFADVYERSHLYRCPMTPCTCTALLAAHIVKSTGYILNLFRIA